MRRSKGSAARCSARSPQRFPEYQALVNPKPPSLAALAKLLTKGEAFVSLYPTEQGTFVWGGGGGGAAGHSRGRDHEGGGGELRVAKLRTRPGSWGKRPIRPAAPFDTASSHRLFTELLAPVRPPGPRAMVITVATASELAQLPFAVLMTRPPESPFDAARTGWLVREVALNQISTAAAFRALREVRRRAGPSGAFFGFGDPLFKSGSGARGHRQRCVHSGNRGRACRR